MLKINVSILSSDLNHPVIDYLNKWILELTIRGHKANIFFDSSMLPGGDILFLVSCSELIRNEDRKKYKSCLVLHASDLPKGRGWSPHIWSVLKGENLITVSLIEAVEPVDTGRIWLKTSFMLEGHELIDEINYKLFESELFLMTQAVEKFYTVNPFQQDGESGEYMKKRSPEDSRLDPYLSIVDQFNLLRVSDPLRYPAFFDYLGFRYLLKIEKFRNE